MIETKEITLAEISFPSCIEKIARDVDRFIINNLSAAKDQKLVESMLYSAIGGGKKIRPFLLMVSALLYDLPYDQALPAASALELIHSYSLIHDDLPIMDNSPLRRGKASCHVQFDPATALLAGDALLTLAFEILADPKTHHDPAVRCAVISEVSKAIGYDGMARGQVLDMLYEHQYPNIEQLTEMQNLKTGKLFSTAGVVGLMLANAPSVKLKHLREFGNKIGLAFQIVDDLLDVQGNEQELGKKTGQDKNLGKANFVSILGIDSAKQYAHQLIEEAKMELEPFAGKARLLIELADFVLYRNK